MQVDRNLNCISWLSVCVHVNIYIYIYEQLLLWCVNCIIYIHSCLLHLLEHACHRSMTLIIAICKTIYIYIMFIYIVLSFKRRVVVPSPSWIPNTNTPKERSTYMEHVHRTWHKFYIYIYIWTLHVHQKPSLITS